jgi:hypothetical protein
MSIFKKPFAPKKAPPRKNITLSPLKLDAAERAREFGLDYGSAYIKLGGQVIKFDKENGDWMSGKEFISIRSKEKIFFII